MTLLTTTMPLPWCEHTANSALPPSSWPREQRPWGWFETLADGEGYRVKRLHIQAGRRISLQRHRQRCEDWLVVGGEGHIECDGVARPVQVGDHVVIPLGARHRAGASGQDLEIIEVQRGPSLREDDIERFEDDFGRVLG